MTRRLVLDASAAIELVLATPQAARIATLMSESTLVVVPDFYCCEVANVLWKYVRRGELTPEEAQEAFADAFDLADSMAPDRGLAQEALAASTLHGHPVYDMVYAVLARRHGCAVVTMDRGFAQLLAGMDIPSHGPKDSEEKGRRPRPVPALPAS